MIEPGKLSDTYSTEKRMTLSAIMRTRRFSIVNNLIDQVIETNGSCNILDIGGSEYYWRLNAPFIDARVGKLLITITNIRAHEVNSVDTQLLRYRVGDCTQPDLYRGDYNFIHSNSVIEHVGRWKNIRAMAANIIQTKLPYYVQTPNYWFPMEPHFRTIGFQWLPLSTRARLLLKRKRGFHRVESFDEAMEEVEGVHLLTGAQLRLLFPNADLLRERFGPFTKSFMAVYRG